MEKERLKYLIDVRQSGQATVEELNELDVWYSELEAQPDATSQLSQHQLILREAALLQQIHRRIDGPKLLWARMIAAAVILVFMTIGWSWYLLV